MSHLIIRLKPQGRFHISRHEFQSGSGLLGNGFEGGLQGQPADFAVHAVVTRIEAVEITAQSLRRVLALFVRDHSLDDALETEVTGPFVGEALRLNVFSLT